ncbi:MAG TPA: hypothetical protein VG125_13550 [Pirellulales bacterium]|jgi:hypothetical protein|nr:hypothetical protein [Pirellulales bacterium]
MTQITVDAELRSKLLNLSEPLDLCDESGRLIGMFMPISSSPPPGYSEPPLSEEEWKRREQEPGYSTEEVLARLRPKRRSQ